MDFVRFFLSKKEKEGALLKGSRVLVGSPLLLFGFYFFFGGCVCVCVV